MTEIETDTTQFPHEGENSPKLDSENENSADPSSEENKTEDGQSPDGQQGANSQDDPDKDTPFHEHPRWKQRESEWDTRFNEQETRHQEDMRKLREEFSGAKKDNAEQTQIPAWFGGDQAQWDAYRKDRDAEITAAEERAVKRISEAKQQQDKAVEAATAFMKSELVAIESDKTLNPDGAKVDPNKLLKVVLDNDLVDSQGRWNYRAGFRLMQQQGTVITKPKPGDKKVIAGATTSENRAETKPATFKTSADFKKNRPW